MRTTSILRGMIRFTGRVRAFDIEGLDQGRRERVNLWLIQPLNPPCLQRRLYALGRITKEQRSSRNPAVAQPQSVVLLGAILMIDCSIY